MYVRPLENGRAPLSIHVEVDSSRSNTLIGYLPIMARFPEGDNAQAYLSLVPIGIVATMDQVDVVSSKSKF